MKVLAIDPGSQHSAFVIYDGHLLHKGQCPNDEILKYVRSGWGKNWHLAIEFIGSYGQKVGRSVFETLFWTGRFVEAWGGDWTAVYRPEVVKFLCGKNKEGSADKRVRAALIGKFGPKLLKGVTGDMWAALGVAVYWWHLHESALVRKS